MDEGLLITFEGVDGCGKSTQCVKVYEQLRYLYPQKEIITTFEPGPTLLGAGIRRLLLHGDAPIGKVAEALLFLADRAQHVEEIIRPALDRGAIVLCDRFIDSFTAYQSISLKHTDELISSLNILASDNIDPDLTFLFDADVGILADRNKAKREDRIEKKGLIFQDLVRGNYLLLAEQQPHRFHIIDATQGEEDITNSIVRTLAETTYVKKCK